MFKPSVLVAAVVIAGAGCATGPDPTDGAYDRYVAIAVAAGVPVEARVDVDKRAARVCGDPVSAADAVAYLGRMSDQLAAIVTAYCPDALEVIAG